MDICPNFTDSKTWLGTSMSDICKGEGFWKFSVSPVTPSKYHSILYQLPADLKEPPKPHLSKSPQKNLWDDSNVQMPHSIKNLFPVKENGADVIKQRWTVIKDTYSNPIKNVRELEAAINTYNKKLPKFDILNHFFDEILEEEQSKNFFDNILPGIINLALSLPDILPSNLPLLKKNYCRSVSLSQLQISSLMANAFLCTFPWKKDTQYPMVNFSRLYSFSVPRKKGCVYEKLKCICNYFQRILKETPKGVVTFERKFIPKNLMPRWDNLEKNLGNTKIHINSEGTIEDHGLGMLQVDFANKFVGGGVLGHGCVQEEIRFVICPELIISRLFVEKLGDCESVIVYGAERYNNYSGYGDTFTWAGDCIDNTPLDDYGRRKTSICIIDATFFNNPQDQFYSSAILRELNKAYAGFNSREKQNLAPVATGNWGCGAFKGNAHLKSLLQLMACSASGRDLVYFSFGNVELMKDFYNMHLFLATHQITISQLWSFLCKFSISKLSPNKLFSFIQQASLDSKKQLTIRHFFSLKPNPLKQNEAIASTSKKQIEEKEEIEEQKPNKLEFKQEKKRISSPQELVDKLPKNHEEILSIFDGNANKCAQKPEENLSFLERIDKLRKNTDGTIRQIGEEAEKMDVDSPSPQWKNFKRKIINYNT